MGWSSRRRCRDGVWGTSYVWHLFQGEKNRVRWKGRKKLKCSVDPSKPWHWPPWQVALEWMPPIRVVLHWAKMTGTLLSHYSSLAGSCPGRVWRQVRWGDPLCWGQTLTEGACWLCFPHLGIKSFLEVVEGGFDSPCLAQRGDQAQTHINENILLFCAHNKVSNARDRWVQQSRKNPWAVPRCNLVSLSSTETGTRGRKEWYFPSTKLVDICLVIKGEGTFTEY